MFRRGFQCVAIIFVLLNMDKGTEALNCYECSGPAEKGIDCEENLENVPHKMCPPNNTTCVSYRFKPPFGPSIIYRHCSLPNTCEFLSNQSLPNNYLEHCQECSSDLCNSSDNLTAFPVKIALFFMLTVSLIY
ncbi:unnamed protein product [Phyllotreta striolata]|uniref:Protein sleepless n=1 Tax=Phyllotreta striolata TaxID=444603 RepID=A0A9N9TUU1_PHYSR|nr:unnamed protein product [Phyllotreta striolata]